MSWNKPSSVPQPPPKKSAPPALKRGLLAGLLVVALGALGLYLFSNGEATSSSLQKKERGRIKEVAPAAAPKSPEVEKEGKRESVGGSKAGKKGKEALPSERRQLTGAALRIAEAEKLGIKPKFEHESECFLAMYAEPGKPVPPPPISKQLIEDMKQALIEPIRVEEGDSEETAALKSVVQGMKKELIAFIKDGGDIEGYFKELDKRQQHEYDMYAEANTSLMKMVNDPDASPEESYEYFKKVNETLDQRGIRRLHIPLKLVKAGYSEGLESQINEEGK